MDGPTNGPTDQPTDRRTTRLLELLRAAKNWGAHKVHICEDPFFTGSSHGIDLPPVFCTVLYYIEMVEDTVQYSATLFCTVS